MSKKHIMLLNSGFVYNDTTHKYYKDQWEVIIKSTLDEEITVSVNNVDYNWAYILRNTLTETVWLLSSIKRINQIIREN